MLFLREQRKIGDYTLAQPAQAYRLEMGADLRFFAGEREQLVHKMDEPIEATFDALERRLVSNQ